MKQLLLLIIILLGLQGNAQLYTFDISDQTTYAYTCGTTTGAYWGVKNDSCDLLTSVVNVYGECFGDTLSLPITLKINQTGQLDCTDTAKISYTVDGGSNWILLDEIIGCEQTANTPYSYLARIPNPSNFQFKVTFDNGSPNDWWQIMDGDIEFGEPCFLLSLDGEHSECATEMTDVELIDNMWRSTTNSHVVPIKFYNLTGDDIKSDLKRDLSVLDQKFGEIELTYYPEIIEIDSQELAIYNKTEEEGLTGLAYDSTCLNIYVVSSIWINSSVSAYAYMPGGKKMVVIAAHALGNRSTMAHEIGHVLGLYHTHHGDAANQDDCEDTGDRVCDTPVDPNLIGQVENCSYVGNQTDAYGEPYQPLVDNIMSYAPSNCRYSFTPGQVERMKRGVEYQRFLVGDEYVDSLRLDEDLVRLNTWPNPAADAVNLSIDTYWQLYDMRGFPVSSGSGTQIRLDGLVAGIYVVHTPVGSNKIVKL